MIGITAHPLLPLSSIAKKGSAAWAKPLNPPPPVEGGTGVFFNGHGSGPESGQILRGFRLSGGPASATGP